VNAKEYIKQLQTYEEYAFSWSEIINHADKSPFTLKKELANLIAKKEIINLRKGFYVIIPPKYAIRNYLPIQLYINKLFSFLNKPYYIGLYSAAKFYGAAHQQIQADYIITKPPALANIKKENFNIKFFTTTHWPSKNIRKLKSDAGMFNISSPALTIADMIHYQTKLGGINRVFTIIEELVHELKPDDIRDLLSWYPYLSTLQRLGFLLEKLNMGYDLLKPLKNHLSRKNYYFVPLNPGKELKPGKAKNFWKVNENVKPESDL